MDSGPDIDNDVVVVVCDPTSPWDGRERQLELHLYGSHSDTVAWTPPREKYKYSGGSPVVLGFSPSKPDRRGLNRTTSGHPCGRETAVGQRAVCHGTATHHMY
jgi:hypothetical protein